MSFILDALRKSETERQRQSGPGLADAGLRPPARRRAIWLPLLVVVLTANLLLLAFVWLRSDRPPPAPPPTIAATAPGSPRIAAPAPAESRPRTQADYEAMADMPALEPDEPLAATPPRTDASQAVPDPAVAPVTEPSAPQPGTVTDALPTAGQLMASGAVPTRPLHLDIHVFSDTPAERFVFVNMRKYTEGAQLAEGPQVEEITPEGVVLSENGQRFLLTRD
ncbi:MAG: hypothetical protein AMXMBFR8_28760 [Nevskiales bacterium]